MWELQGQPSLSVCLSVLSVFPSYYNLHRCHPKTCMLRLGPREKVKSLGTSVLYRSSLVLHHPVASSSFYHVLPTGMVCLAHT